MRGAGLATAFLLKIDLNWPFPMIFLHKPLADHLHLISKPNESNLTWILAQNKTELISVPLHEIKDIISQLSVISKPFSHPFCVKVHCFRFRMQTVLKTTQVVCTVLLKQSQRI